MTKTYGRDQELAYQLGLRSAELKRDFEYALVGVNQAKISGSDTVARQFANYLALLDNSALYTVNSTWWVHVEHARSPRRPRARSPSRHREHRLLSSSTSTASTPDVIMVKPADSAGRV